MARPMNIGEKILSRASGVESVEPGDTVFANVRFAMIHDITGPPAVESMVKAFGKDARVWDPGSVVVMPDHLLRGDGKGAIEFVDDGSRALYRALHDFVGAQSIRHFYSPEAGEHGVCHSLFCQMGFAVPGEVVIGADSHTVTYGAYGCFAAGVGSTDMAGVLKTGKIWLRVPETSRVVLDGPLRPGVMAKDINLKLIEDFGEEGFVYESIEYGGAGISRLGMDERMSLTNMAIEEGAKNGVVPPDQVTEAALRGVAKAPPRPLLPDEKADYRRVIRYDAGDIEPLVWLPPPLAASREPKIVPASQVETKRVKINEAWIGSCTGGKVADYAAAAMVLRHGRVAEGVRLVCTPSTTLVEKQLHATRIEGRPIHNILAEAGAEFTAPTCGACFGGHGRFGENQVAITSSSRNTRGRMGPASTDVYLANPATVAASALKGYIAAPPDTALRPAPRPKPRVQTNGHRPRATAPGEKHAPGEQESSRETPRPHRETPALSKRGSIETPQRVPKTPVPADRGPIRGRVFVVGENINTDIIIPTRWLGSNDPRVLAQGAMKGLQPSHTPQDAAEFETGRYPILVAGNNFGCGSSREHAVWALQGAGVRAVVVHGQIARIFYRNAINNAMPALAAPGKLSVHTGDEVELHLDGTLRAGGHSYPVEPLRGIAADIVTAGGLLPYLQGRKNTQPQHPAGRG
ncbi:MAG: 3-isopropylmalate dehydratase large subunit [Euryarchaeota archaeon]|nr:3-isopropylmalate dehydratase large subunit [Euryarchaeota archaeon]